MEKRKVAVVTDSTAFLSDEQREQYQIEVIPLHLHWGQDNFLDGIDITVEEFYARLAEAPQLPTTSQPSVGEFAEFFKRVAESAESIVGVFVSAELSGTMASARAAVEMVPEVPIEVIDSRSVSAGLGLMAIAGAEAAQAGASQAEVARIIREIVPRMRVLFVVDTLEYLHKGGRIGGAKRLIGSMLSVKPLLHLLDGRVEPLASKRTKPKALAELLNIVATETQHFDTVHAAVIDAMSPQEGDRFCAQVEEKIHPATLFRLELSPVVGTYGGPGTIGVGFYGEKA